MEKFLKLDFNNFKNNIGTIEKNDTTELEIILQDNQNYEGCIFRLLGKKTDNTYIEQLDNIIFENNKLLIKLNEQFTNIEGMVLCELNTIKGANEVTSKRFYFYVSDNLNSDIVQSRNTIPTLDKLDQYLDKATVELTEFEVLKNELLQANNEIKNDELTRKANEMLRVKDEKVRLSNETSRTTNEEERQRNELERITNENKRKENELARRTSENTRISRENSREEAELNRQRTFEENENIRTENENIRIINENNRKISFDKSMYAEELRESKELARINNEDTRKANEKIRIANEEERKSNEIIREENYNNFNSSEEIRQANEKVRINNENTRIEAEKTRDSRYEVAEANRQKTFEGSEVAREKAFTIAETIRNNNETDRIAFENTRKANEETRKENEVARVNAENNRVDSENTRKTNETNRVNAENARIVSMQDIETRFEVIESNATKTEVDNARVDFFGSNHVNLQDRLTKDFSEVHNAVNNASLLQYEGESITATNSFNGYTDDMTIKGNTMQNLVNLYPSMPRIETVAVGRYFNEAYFSSLVKSNTTYTVFWDIEKITDTNDHNPQLSIGFSDSRGSFIADFQYCSLVGKSGETYYKHKQVFTLPDMSKYTGLGIRLPRYGKPLENRVEYKINNIMLLEGDYTNKPTPDYFTGITSSGENDNKICIESTGKNICKVDSFTFTPQKLPNDAVSQTNKIIVKNIKINPNYSYILSSNVNFTKMLVSKTKQSEEVIDHNNLYTDTVRNLGGIEVSNNIIPKGYNYVSITTGGTAPVQQAPVGKELTINNIQLEEGTIVTAYEPFKNNLLEIPIDEPLRSLSNMVKDEIKEDGKLIKRIDKIILNGSEPWNIIKYDDTKIRFTYMNTNIKKNSSIICDKLASVSHIEIVKFQVSNVISIHDGEKSINIILEKTKLSTPDIEGFKKWLASNPTTVYYELDTPIETQLPLSNINLRTYEGTTYINSNTYIKTIQSCKVPSNVPATIQSLRKEDEFLTNEVNKTDKLANTNFKDINDNIFPYVMELDFTIMDLVDKLGVVLEPMSSLTKNGGIRMTSFEALKRLIITKGITLSEALKRVEQYRARKRITDEEALILIDLAHDYLD